MSITEHEKKIHGLVDVGNLAQWSASTEKTGFPISNVRDDDINTYWQSDGSQPHVLYAKFIKRVEIKYLSIYLMYSLDESYTPSKIRIAAGTGLHDLQPVVTTELEEQEGWLHIPVGDYGRNGLLETYMLQLSILSNHQNGKDSHIRLIKIYAPEAPQALAVDEIPYTSIQFHSRSQLR
ncbi:anaphase-promoting complex subunit Apc10 [Schizosaccharomyces japonicus yFS275]|uniref:Anaphase-promoting complex subunit 10 n=1 Tax=Schizosaccharomyces japonicus (strain yFS275 / FY16936) TaxID=402676 RepID=B6K4J9_SCHJY|nr:anaphase-promoting complex subunit Apc10 [Schizosaccharomyces japonicus yFS275]EEB08406.1 anaphase-promoting complex subunit Apc10 [Schizosaccharomyces japonicus yFS275]